MVPVKVLIIDDSALAREILMKGLSGYNDIQVIGTASDVFEGRDKIVLLKPDVLTLDIEMPKMDGVEFIKRLIPQYSIPIVVVSSVASDNAQVTLDALDYGAVDYIQKPSVQSGRKLMDMIDELQKKIICASTVKVNAVKKNYSYIPGKRKNAIQNKEEKVIVIGASTGGTIALRKILEEFPSDMPGCVIVQHMPAGFTKMFAKRLNKSCLVEVKEAEDGDRVMRGLVLISPGDRQIFLKKRGEKYIVNCILSEPVNGHCPSVEPLFDSAAQNSGSNTIGVMLTGMGSDGANAMVRLKKSGARTIAQDKDTSVVFGMPFEAYKRGGAELLLPINKITDQILSFLKEME